MLKFLHKYGIWAALGSALWLLNTSTAWGEAQAEKPAAQQKAPARPVDPFEKFKERHAQALARIASPETNTLSIGDLADALAAELLLTRGELAERGIPAVEANYNQPVVRDSERFAPREGNEQDIQPLRLADAFRSTCAGKGEANPRFTELLQSVVKSDSDPSGEKHSEGGVTKTASTTPGVKEACSKLKESSDKVIVDLASNSTGEPNAAGGGEVPGSGSVEDDVAGNQDPNNPNAQQQAKKDEEKDRRGAADDDAEKQALKDELDRQRLANALAGLQNGQGQGEGEGGGGSGSGGGDSGGGAGGGSGGGAGGGSGAGSPKIPKGSDTKALADLLKNKNNNGNNDFLKAFAESGNKNKDGKEKEKKEGKSLFDLVSSPKKKTEDDNLLKPPPPKDEGPVDAFAGAAAPPQPGQALPAMPPQQFPQPAFFGNAGFGAGGAGGFGGGLGMVGSNLGGGGGGLDGDGGLPQLGNEGQGVSNGAGYKIPLVNAGFSSGFSGGGEDLEESSGEGDAVIATYGGGTRPSTRGLSPDANLGYTRGDTGPEWIFNAISHQLNGSICALPEKERPSICFHPRTPQHGPKLNFGSGADLPS